MISMEGVKMDRTRRVNMHVTPEVNQWFENKSIRTGVSKSALMYMALEHYILNQSHLESEFKVHLQAKV